jgi:hypothetical protein
MMPGGVPPPCSGSNSATRCQERPRCGCSWLEQQLRSRCRTRWGASAELTELTELTRPRWSYRAQDRAVSVPDLTSDPTSEPSFRHGT